MASIEPGNSDNINTVISILKGYSSIRTGRLAFIEIFAADWIKQNIFFDTFYISKLCYSITQFSSLGFWFYKNTSMKIQICLDWECDGMRSVAMS